MADLLTDDADGGVLPEEWLPWVVWIFSQRVHVYEALKATAASVLLGLIERRDAEAANGVRDGQFVCERVSQQLGIREHDDVVEDVGMRGQEPASHTDGVQFGRRGETLAQRGPSASHPLPGAQIEG